MQFTQFRNDWKQEVHMILIHHSLASFSSRNSFIIEKYDNLEILDLSQMNLFVSLRLVLDFIISFLLFSNILLPFLLSIEFTLDFLVTIDTYHDLEFLNLWVFSVSKIASLFQVRFSAARYMPLGITP